MAVQTDAVTSLGAATTKPGLNMALQDCDWNTSECWICLLLATRFGLFLENGPAGKWTSHINLRCEDTKTNKSKPSSKLPTGRHVDLFSS